MFVEVIVDILNSEIDKVFDYYTSTQIEAGTRVVVPFGTRKVEGYVLRSKQATTFDKGKIKSVLSADDKPVILPEMLKMIDFLTENFNLRKMDAIRLFVPSGLRKNKVKQKVVKFLQIANSDYGTKNFKKTAKNQIELYDFLKKNQQIELSLANKTYSSQAVKKLIELGLAKVFEEQQSRKITDYGIQQKDVLLTKTQQDVVSAITSQKDAKTFLLFGVTGSGKTEVYMNVIKSAINQGKTAIMLVPEISLTPQVLKHFRAKFGDNVAILHSGLTQSQRYDEWFRIYHGQAKVVVGARSAVFAPAKNVGVIVIDEEHDTSYYSESNPRYSTIEVAKFRSKFNNCPLVLGSATPDIESYYLAQKGEYQLLQMPERVNKAPMPKIEIVDMLSEIRNGNDSFFSTKLVAEIDDCLKNGKQAMLYLNRRGYNNSVVCRQCGYVVKCEHCDVPLVFHKEDNMLKCHYCDARYRVLSACPNCGSTDLRYGAIGTEKIVEELKRKFPNTKVFRMDNDNTRTKDAHFKILSQFSQTRASILVGTQMIAKGHDFPLVTLVGIIDADMGLHFADFRANERTFSLITQVAGRAGRAEFEGKVILQTYIPNNYVYRCAVNYDYQNFFKHELNIREVTKFPPFTAILRILVSGEDEQKVAKKTKEYWQGVQKIYEEYPGDFVYLSAMKCPKKKIQNKIRYQILMRITQKDYTKIRNLIYNLDRNLKQKDIISFVEVNPQNLS